METVLEAPSLGFIRNLYHRITGELVENSQIIAEHEAYCRREKHFKETGIWEPVNEFGGANGS